MNKKYLVVFIFSVKSEQTVPDIETTVTGKTETTSQSTLEILTTFPTKEHTTEKITTKKHTTVNPTTQTTKEHTTENPTTQTTKEHTTENPTTHTTKEYTTESSTTHTTKEHTTANPSTRTTKVITTYFSTPQTTKSPEDKVKYYFQQDGIICVIIEASNITIKINKDNYFIPTNVRVNGTCSANTDVIEISWTIPPTSRKLFAIPNMSDENQMKLTMTFDKNEPIVSLNEIIVSHKNVTLKAKPGSNFAVNKDGSFSCDNVHQELKGTTGVSGSIYMENFKFEAFRNSNSTKLQDTKANCLGRNPTVAIIVGAVLAGFLVVVLIIFIIFRYRASRRQGYQQIL